MKARLFKINNNWFAILPPQDLFYRVEITDEKYAQQYSVSIYQLELIKDKSSWHNNDWVNGNIIRINNRVYFKIDGVEYDNPIKNEDSKTVALLKGIMGDNQRVAITLEQYQYIQYIAKSENMITCYFSNGYCINHKYVIFGKLTNNKKIIYPQIKIK